MPTVLTGTIDEAVGKIERVRRLGVDYLTLTRTPGVSWNVLEQLATALRSAS